MDRQGFDRALEFFRYSRVSATLALVASILTGVVYLGLLVLLGLFFDLCVHQGKIPCLSQLPPAERDAFLVSVQIPADAENRADRVKAQAQRIAELKLALRPGEEVGADRLALLWMAEAIATIESDLGPDAAEIVRAKFAENVKTLRLSAALCTDLDDFGILGLVVRTRSSFQRWFIRPFASRNDWTWRAGNLGYLEGLLVAALLFTIVRGMLFFSGNVLAARAVVETVTRLRKALYLQTFRLGTLAFRSLGPTEAVGVSTRQLESVHEGLYLWLTEYYREPVKFGCVLLFALLVNFWLAVILLMLAGLVWLIAGQVAAHFRAKIAVAEQATGEQLALLQESLMLMRLVKLYLMEQFNLARFEKQTAAYAAAQSTRYWSDSIYRGVFRLVAILASLGVLYLAGRVIVEGSLGASSALVMTAALVSLYFPAVRWLETRRLVRRGRDSAKTLFDFLDKPGTVGQAVEAEFLAPLAKSVEFDNVSLREPGTGKRLLKGVNLVIRAGQHVALVGPDELEKHAIVYLLCRFLDPAQGEIRIDKKNIRWVTLDSLRNQVATVLQHNLVYNDTVANNIACGDPAFNLSRIIEAAKIAHAHHFIQKLPKGYDTLIGDLGHALKPGEKFRVALARAILRDPALLVIEEPVGALDDDTKAMIDDTFARILSGRTVLFLPHRLSTLKSCDRVYFLHEGKIVDQGEHRELLQTNDLYRHLQYLEFNEFAGMFTPQTPSLPDVKI